MEIIDFAQEGDGKIEVVLQVSSGLLALDIDAEIPSFKGDGFEVLVNRLRDNGDDEVAVTVKLFNELLDKPDFDGQLYSLKCKNEVEALKVEEAYLLDSLADVQARIKKLSSK